MSWDLLFLRLLAAGALTAGGTEEAPELAHHVRQLVAGYRWSGQNLRQGVQHLGGVGVLVDVVDVVDVDVVEVDVVDVVV